MAELTKREKSILAAVSVGDGFFTGPGTKEALASLQRAKLIRSTWVITERGKQKIAQMYRPGIAE